MILQYNINTTFTIYASIQNLINIVFYYQTNIKIFII